MVELRRETIEGTRSTSVGWSNPAKMRGPTYLSKPCNVCAKEFPREEFLVGKARKHTRGMCRKCYNAKQNVNDKVPRNRFSHAKSLAKRSGREWKLSFEEWSALVQLPCDYCGAKLHEHGRGIDRMDNSDCYKPGNCVPCCALCNQGKAGTYTHEEYKEIGALNRKFRERRERLGLPPLETWISYRKGKRPV